MKTFLVNGNATSMWGESKGRFVVTEMAIDCDDECNENNRFTGNLTITGKNLSYHHYTDEAIEKAFNNPKKPIAIALKSLVESEVGHFIKDMKVEWSEYGMQPSRGWNFDVSWEKA